MPSKYQEYRQMADTAERQLTSSYKSWTQFLRTAARLYKYPYNEQVMIHAQRPDATACAEYDFWNKKMGRFIRRGSTGIALIDTSGQKPQLRYVFDVADTGEREHSRPVHLWRFRAEHEDIVAATLERSYDVSVSDGIVEQMESAAKLQQIDGRGYSSIHSIRGVLRPAFQMAVDDDLLRKNPFEFELASVIVNDSVTREAITRKQQRDLLKFIQEDKHFSRYYDAIYILFHTGLRISEFCGLTVSEIEYGEMRIKVDHQLQRTAQMQYVIEEPKTDKGIRYVPMTEAVAACFRRIIANRKTPKVEPMVEGYAGFLFLDKNDMPMVALHWEKYLEHIIQKYNKIYRIQMPKVTPHVCRHTFCSNMAKSGMNPKTLQYIMGHADISVTLNTYTHVNFDDAKEEVYRIANS